MIFMATVPSTNGSRPIAKLARGSSPSANPRRSTSMAETAASLSNRTCPLEIRVRPPELARYSG